MKQDQFQLTNPGPNKTPWFLRLSSRFKKDQELITKEYPFLKFVTNVSKVYLEGEIAIYDKQGQNELTRYLVRVDFPDEYPKAIPIVYELGGKVTRTTDWHVNSADGSLCIFLPEAINLDLDKKHTIVDFLDAVYGFLVQHYIKLHTGKYPQGAWSHGNNGILDFYREELGVHDDKILARLLYHLIAPRRGQIPVNAPCPCEQKKKFKKCHLSTLILLEGKTTKTRIQSALSLLLKSIKIQKEDKHP